MIEQNSRGSRQVQISDPELRDLIKQHEGVKLMPYRDSVGKLTIGVGHNLSDLGLPISIVENLFDHDLVNVMDSYCVIFDSAVRSELSYNRQLVLLVMIFNLGEMGFRRFAKLIKAINSRNYNEAAAEMEDSKWFGQVGSRAVELQQMMIKG